MPASPAASCEGALAARMGRGGLAGLRREGVTAAGESCVLQIGDLGAGAPLEAQNPEPGQPGVEFASKGWDSAARLLLCKAARHLGGGKGNPEWSARLGVYPATRRSL